MSIFLSAKIIWFKDTFGFGMKYEVVFKRGRERETKNQCVYYRTITKL